MKTLKLLEQLRHCPHDRKFRAALQEAGITLPEKPAMKTAPFNLGKALAGHLLITRGGELVTGFQRRDPDDGLIWDRESYPYSLSGIRSYRADGRFEKGVESRHDLFLALPDDLPLSPEEQAVIDAMRAGRKVTVEEPKMPRRCWAHFNPAADEHCDPWINIYGMEQKCFVSEEATVQLIELTPEVSAALLAAGIRWEDAPTGNRLPEGLSPLPEGVPPLPEGAVYLGMGRTFKNPKRGFPGFASYGGGDPWEWQDEWVANSGDLHYAAHADSEIVRLNRNLVDNPTPTL